MLTGISIDKNSEVLAALGIPYYIVQKIAELPKDILSAKVDVNNSEANYSKSQTQLLQALDALQKQTESQKLEQKAPGTTRVSNGITPPPG